MAELLILLFIGFVILTLLTIGLSTIDFLDDLCYKYEEHSYYRNLRKNTYIQQRLDRTRYNILFLPVNITRAWYLSNVTTLKS